MFRPVCRNVVSKFRFVVSKFRFVVSKFRSAVTKFDLAVAPKDENQVARRLEVVH